jgi:large subunit ribosomal protein L24
MIARVRKNDTVIILAGKDKGKQSSVIEIFPKKGKVIVKDIAIVTRHVKARKQGDVAGIKKEEGYIQLSKVMPICSSCKNPCRINTKLVDNKRVRVCNNCKEIF